MDELTHLLVQATGGDRDALNEFVTRAQPDVWRFCAALLSADQADDATQETFVRAWRAAGGFRGDSSAKTWLLAIAKRVCFDAMRQRVRADRRYDRLVAATQSTDAPDHGESVVMADLVDRLDPDRRSAFVLTQLLGLSYEEAASVADCPIGTIRSRVARARSDLQELLSAGETSARASAGAATSTGRASGGRASGSAASSGSASSGSASSGRAPSGGWIGRAPGPRRGPGQRSRS